MNERIEALRKRLDAVRLAIPDGASSDEQIAKYFSEQEAIIEGVLETLGKMHEASTTEAEGVRDAVKNLRETLRTSSTEMKSLSRRDIEYGIGKALVGAWTNDRRMLGEAKCFPNLRSEKWSNPKDFTWSADKGFSFTKDALGQPMGDMSTNEQYLINPIYEDTILTDAASKSVMMPLVTTRPMTGPSVFIPEHDRGGVSLKWLTALGQKIEGSKPEGATRKELKAYTLAGYIPWFDEFEEDVFVDLGKMFMEEFSDCYAAEFDRQCLVADNDPFTGALACTDVTAHVFSGADVAKLTYTDFRDAVLKVKAEERKDCRWFLSETVLNHVRNLKDADGNMIWGKPEDKKPGTIDGYGYYECSALPQLNEVGKNTAFAIFMNPKRIIHGNRKGIEIRRFNSTTEGLEYGENFIRFRKRSGFLVTRAKGNMVALKTGAS